MRKPRRGIGILLAFVLVVPAPALTGCRGTSSAVGQAFDESVRRAADQTLRNGMKRVGPGAGAGGVFVGGCAASNTCP